MKAVMYGAGNIGRGFIGQKFYLSGYETVFIDVNMAVVDAINASGEYPVYVTGKDSYDEQPVKNVSAVDGRDNEKVIETISGCDILATALGVNVIKFVAPLIAKAIEKRYNDGAKPLNILICENMIGSNVYLHDLVAANIGDEYKDYLESSIGFVCVSVGRMVPPTPEELAAKNSLAVCVEPYSKLPVDADGFRPVGGEYPPIKGLVPFAPFEFFIEQKLMMHNMGHAVTSYLGFLKGYEYIWEASFDAEIKYIMTRALFESGMALSKKHGADLSEVLEYVEDLNVRFENKLLGDTILRVGRDTKRKLGEGDRLVAAYKTAKECGIVPAHIALGIAAGFLFAHPGDETALETSAYAKENGIAAALEKYSNITDASDVAVISKFYDMLASKASFTELCRELATLKFKEH